MILFAVHRLFLLDLRNVDVEGNMKFDDLVSLLILLLSLLLFLLFVLLLVCVPVNLLLHIQGYNED